MCDFSLHAVRSRPAKVGDKLTTRMFNLGTGASAHPKITEWQFVCFRARSCPSRTKLGDGPCGRPRGMKR
jgi:hypothetical protein